MVRAQNEIASVAVVLHQSGFPQMPHGRFFVTRLYPVPVILAFLPAAMPAACLSFDITMLISKNGLHLYFEKVG
ncbi:MAG: hypothetical protein K1X52_14710 [Pyrinomonadaceae bacterium]|nr:hypothetical protein [Pyrinomonadaceae bacterium]